MKIDSRSSTHIPARRIGWFLRLAQQRRWFHESLFRQPSRPRIEPRPEPGESGGKSGEFAQ